ncbi:ABC transporter permease [Emergencia sp. 1XD21-10]|uniref:ABC transporter permease n=1 Tax=Emergencia sp. 1XD21-10 TaxID=2304569 RepID=UPI00137A6DCE|nr:ABC transporter permease [Emergencia sp. 1XD21-10]MCI9639712.1 ABC transporter permease [Emergencia sp.]NCE98549.1 ABC transporter permease [Emergencia sp. 1XD21-10]
MNQLKEKINVRYIGTLAACIIAALLIGAVLMVLTGFNPFEAYGAMIEGALGSPRFIGNTLERAMLLCLLGLATAIGAKGGLFNVGGEGQLFFGALTSTMIGLWCSNLPTIVVVVLSFIGAVVVGGFYAWIPALLKVKLGVSEVITTIMLNTVAIKVCTYLVNGPWNAPSAAIAKGTEYLPDTLRFTKLIQASNLTTGFIGGAVVAFFIWYVMKMTSTGLQIKVTGENERFARFAGLPSSKLMIGSMVASGAICGFVGMFLVYGSQGHMTEAVSNEFYFDGMLVAMIMNYNPIGIIIMSFFFAIMSVGAAYMDMMVGISTQIYDIIFSIIIFLMAAEKGINAWLEHRKLQKKARKELK